MLSPFSIPRKVPIPLRQSLKDELDKMVEEGVIEPVDHATDWCAPMVVVPKKNGKVRICVDLTKLNENVKRQYHPLPAVDYELGLLAGAKVFSKLDANSGFWQVQLADESKDLTTFLTPFGRFRFTRMPFGITSAPEHFQKKVDRALEGLSNQMAHMDDVLVWGQTQEEHDISLHKVLKKLEEAGMTLNKEKCVFNQRDHLPWTSAVSRRCSFR